jgi:YbgC/YbaW family acyl-CoA thioester hydrolase
MSQPAAGKIYRAELEVRGYELDSFGHVNHANYLNYFEFARWKLLAEENITLEDFRAWDRFPVIANLEIRYLRPTLMGDHLVVETKMISHGRSSSQFEQRILKGDKEVCVAKVRSVLVDGKGKPAEAPSELKNRWTAIAGEDEKNHE